MSEPRKLKVSLLDGPQYPMETLFAIWEQSRSNKKIPLPSALFELTDSIYDPNATDYEMLKDLGFPYDRDGFRDYFNRIVSQLLTEGVPITECIYFTFLLENIPLSLREQLVRHRIGNHKEGGTDMIPDLPSSTFWAQTGRVMDMSKFFEEGRYFLPESADETPIAEEHPVTSREDAYFHAMRTCESAYRDLVSSGMPIEDARNVLPIAMTHSMTWTINIKALGHVIGKRSCWISQGGLWHDLITQLMNALCERHPIFRELVNPPCIKKNEWVECPYTLVNTDRLNGVENYPPCPLWLRHNMKDWIGVNEIQTQMNEKMRQQYRSLWNRDVDTGVKL